MTYIAQGKEENEFSKMKEGIGANIDCLPGKELYTVMIKQCNRPYSLI